MLATRDPTPFNANIINLHGPQALNHTTLKSLIERCMYGRETTTVTPTSPKIGTPPKTNSMPFTPFDNIPSRMDRNSAQRSSATMQTEDELLIKYYAYLALAGKVFTFVLNRNRLVRERTNFSTQRLKGLVLLNW
jgi:hypothetical protein